MKMLYPNPMAGRLKSALSRQVIFAPTEWTSLPQLRVLSRLVTVWLLSLETLYFQGLVLFLSDLISTSHHTTTHPPVMSGEANTSGNSEDREDDGGNILDDILNTKEEKFEDEEPVKSGESLLDDDDDESLEDHDIKQERDGDLLGSDISDSTDTEEDKGDHSDISVTRGSDSETGESVDSKDKVKVEKRSPSPDSEDAASKADDEEEKDVPERKKKGKKYDYATKLNYLFRDARFFLVKSNNPENVNLAKVSEIVVVSVFSLLVDSLQSKSVWSTPPQNEAKFNQAFVESRNVLLIFSVKV